MLAMNDTASILGGLFFKYALKGITELEIKKRKNNKEITVEGRPHNRGFNHRTSTDCRFLFIVNWFWDVSYIFVVRHVRHAGFWLHPDGSLIINLLDNSTHYARRSSTLIRTREPIIPFVANTIFVWQKPQYWKHYECGIWRWHLLGITYNNGGTKHVQQNNFWSIQDY